MAKQFEGLQVEGLQALTAQFQKHIADPDSYVQLSIVAVIYVLAWLLQLRVAKTINGSAPSGQQAGLLKQLGLAALTKLGAVFFPIFVIVLLKLSVAFAYPIADKPVVLELALKLSLLILFSSIVGALVKDPALARIFRWVGLPLIFLYVINVLPFIVEVLDTVSIDAGNFHLSLYDVLRTLLFGSLLFWLGRISNAAGKNAIRRQAGFDVRTREVVAKLFEIVVFIIVSIVLLQIMGVNLTAFAIFGGALGVGLGFGLQSIASNFTSGVIILLDRSISIGDYVEMADGKCGIVRQLDLRATTIETFDGKDIVIPNDKFITEVFTNWTHKDDKQRYRVDFSVAYDSDIHKLVALIKEAVAAHPQVICNEDTPIEERPDCEIDSFGDSGINMFVEFWMQGIDDGKNRVGGDLLLVILDTLRDNGFSIPFPQREVRVVNDEVRIKRMT